MRLWRAIVEFYEWLPLLALPFVIVVLTDWFSRSLELEIWLIIAVAAILNLGWIAFGRYTRNTADFLKKYPGFRMNKNG